MDSVGKLDQALEKFLFSWSSQTRADFYEMLASMIRDGKPLNTSIEQLRNRFMRKKRQYAAMTAQWASAMQTGATFSDAIRGYANETEAVIIAAAERSGDVAAGLEQAAALARARAQMTSEIVSKTSGPVIKLLLLALMLVGFSKEIAPELMKSIPMWAMTESQKTLFALSDVIAGWWGAFLVVMAVIAAAVVWSLPRYTGPGRELMDRLPPWSIYKVSAGSTFMVSLSCLMQAGVPIDAAIRYMQDKSSPYLRSHLMTMRGRMLAGYDQGEALDTGLLGPRVSDLVVIYSKTSSFESVVRSVGRMAMDAGIKDVSQKASTANVLSTLILGVMLAWMFSAVMDIGQAAQRMQAGKPPVTAAQQK